MVITNNIQELLPVFKAGGVFAYPTESIFGLGCNPEDLEAVNKLLLLKERSVRKGLILIASDFSQVQQYLKPLNQSQKLLTKPSETTYVYPALATAPKWLTGDFDSLAVRVTKHIVAKNLCEAMNSALVSTSANISGRDPARSAGEVFRQLGNKIDVILDGKLGNLSQPSEIRDSISGEKIR